MGARIRAETRLEGPNDEATAYLASTNLTDSEIKPTRLLETTGSGGKRALEALVDGRRQAADVFLRLSDDAATQRAFLRAWEQKEFYLPLTGAEPSNRSR